MTESKGEDAVGRTDPLDERDVAAFAEKLESWGAGLPERERVFLRLLVERARDPIPRLTEFEGIRSLPISTVLPRLIREYGACKQIFYDSDGGVWLKAMPVWLRRTP